MSVPRVVEVAFDYTLMRLVDGPARTFAPSGTQQRRWFFELADSEGVAVGLALTEVFALENARLRAREPNDPNHLAPVGFKHAVVEPPPTGPFPWEKERKVWERSTCWTSSPTMKTWTPVQPGDFTMLYLVRRIQAGALDRETFMRLATKDLFSLPADQVAKVFDDPESMVRKLVV